MEERFPTGKVGEIFQAKRTVCQYMRGTKKSGIKEDDLLEYEDVIRPFEVNANVEFTDVWTFPSVKTYKGKHPAEKPVKMLEHCILSTTFPRRHCT